MFELRGQLPEQSPGKEVSNQEQNVLEEEASEDPEDNEQVLHAE